MKHLFITICLVLASTATQAEVCTLKKNAVLIKSDRVSEFFSLISAGKNGEAFRCCVACFVNKGDSVVLVNHGFFSHTVRLLDGHASSCTGDIPVEELSDCK